MTHLEQLKTIAYDYAWDEFKRVYPGNTINVEDTALAKFAELLYIEAMQEIVKIVPISEQTKIATNLQDVLDKLEAEV